MHDLRLLQPIRRRRTPWSGRSRSKRRLNTLNTRKAMYVILCRVGKFRYLRAGRSKNDEGPIRAPASSMRASLTPHYACCVPLCEIHHRQQHTISVNRAIDALYGTQRSARPSNLCGNHQTLRCGNRYCSCPNHSGNFFEMRWCSRDRPALHDQDRRRAPRVQ
jgi:hypothetical protein